jgi:hypothetical protein
MSALLQRGPSVGGTLCSPENGDTSSTGRFGWSGATAAYLRLALGRLWCGNVCPLRLVTDAGRSLGDWLRGRSSPTSPYLRMGWVLPRSFILITYFVKSWPIQTEARLGAYMFLTIFALAFLVGAVFRRGTWCRYLCPVGGWLARISRLSAIAVRPNADICAGCVDKPCLAGTVAGRCPSYLNPSHLDSSRYCLECWVCVRNCPIEKSSMKVGWRLPGAELARPRPRHLGVRLHRRPLAWQLLSPPPSRWAGVAAALVPGVLWLHGHRGRLLRIALPGGGGPPRCALPRGALTSATLPALSLLPPSPRSATTPWSSSTSWCQSGGRPPNRRFRLERLRARLDPPPAGPDDGGGSARSPAVGGPSPLSSSCGWAGTLPVRL